MPGLWRHGACGMTTASVIRPRRRVFAGSGEQVGLARSFIAQMLGGCPVMEEAVLLTSELVTNAIKHTASGRGGKVIVTVYRGDTRLRVEVRDDGSEQVPVVRPCDEARDSGYGLDLVELMAQSWGHHGGRRCRVVWFMLDWKTIS
jgi:anti-sigma regulatory factor (Ser/Thr protein kinase)